jgi:DHA1 family inner membrane transport protein
VPWLLVLFGVGLFVGNVWGGRAADRDLVRTLLVVLAALTVVLAVFALTASSKPLTVAALLLMGGVGFATVPGLQMRVMRYASTAPTLASGANIAAFNLGNALGAWIGGAVLERGYALDRLPLVAAAVALAALLLTALAAWLDRREAATARGPLSAEAS